VRGDDAILFEDDTLKLHDERTRQACPKPSAAGASRAAGLWGVSEATFYAPPATRSVIFSARSRTLPAGSAIADRGPCCVPLDNPEIDAHFNVPDAPTPKCPEGMTWDHTSGMDDTPSGDLEVGQYAQLCDGTYIAHYLSMRYTSATSTSDWPARISVVSGDVSVLAQ
jgi:hypothetical protein